MLHDLCGVGDEEHEVFEELRREASTSGGWSFTYRLSQSSGHACVEVADPADRDRAVRDSKD